jgi:ADP-heptose:LPS heptosyltransferase
MDIDRLRPFDGLVEQPWCGFPERCFARVQREAIPESAMLLPGTSSSNERCPGRPGMVNPDPMNSPSGNSDPDVIVRYRSRYQRQDRLVALFDSVLGLGVPRSRRPQFPSRPERILLANAGHLGDALMSVALVPAIKHVYPQAFIGFLTGTYSRAAVEGHPLLDRVHYLDHWRASRTNIPLRSRLSAYYLRAMPAMARELSAMSYDIALDLHAWFPNFIPLLWRAGIPVRVGFHRVGFAPLLTHVHKYEYDRRHEMEHQCDLLRLWGLPPESIELARPSIATVPAKALLKVNELLQGMSRYRVLHPASSTPVRDWSASSWSELANNLQKTGITAVITGAGTRDAAIAEQICNSAPSAINAVNRLSWHELMALLSKAEAVYSVDTSIGHAAAALGRPVISIIGGMVDSQHWGPLGAKIVSNPVPCLPCFDKRGCAHRSCLLGVDVSDVEKAATELLG